MTLYEIIKALQNASGSKAKQAILEEHKESGLLQVYLGDVYDPAMNYYIKKIPKVESVGDMSFSIDTIAGIETYLANRRVTGKKAQEWLAEWMECYDAEGQELITYLIKRDIKAGIAEGTILKVWPDLFFIPPYQRCSLMDAKIKASFDKLPFWFVQSKLDGSFAYLKRSKSTSEAITRAGSIYPTWLSEKLSRGVSDGFVVVGEMLVYRDGKVLSRQEGNGILNSILQGADEGEFATLTFQMTAWDLLTVEEFEQGSSTRKYIERFNRLDDLCEYRTPHIKLVSHWNVNTMEEAYKIYAEHLSRGEEGCIIKHPNSVWKDGTSKDMVKLKLEFEADYIVTGIFEGNGKYTGMLGGYNCETSDGGIKFSVGSGFTDAQRVLDESVIGKIVTVKANDVIKRDGSDIMSLFLPIFCEVRFDKTQADSTKRVLEQLKAAKEGK